MSAAVVPPLLRRSRIQQARNLALFIIVCVGLWRISVHDYLLFHGVVEVISVAIASAIFMISWSSRGYDETRPFVMLGISYGFVAILDLLHTFTYQGMTVITLGQDYATKLWVAARGLQALGTLAFVLLARWRRTAPSWAVFLVVGGATVIVVLSIFVWQIFPLCFVEGQGVTMFKKASEYVITAVLVVSIALLVRGEYPLSNQERWLLVGALALNAASELVFTLYVSAYGYQNLIGHQLKLGSFLLAYHALFSTKVRAREALISELRQSTARLEKSQADLRAANLSKDRFFSIIAHDLRNPIAGILSISEVLERRFDQLDAKRVRELCGFVRDGAVETSELLESILQWARAQTGRWQAKPSAIPVAALCDGVVSLQRPGAEQKGISIDVSVRPDARAWADEDMFATVLRNLLSNAVKFTDRGGSVKVYSTPDAELEHITVSDTGRGMSPEEIGKLFQIGVHYSSPGTSGERGSGMGLVLCHELVALNRGTMTVKSAVGQGSSFTLSLPRPCRGS